MEGKKQTGRRGGKTGTSKTSARGGKPRGSRTSMTEKKNQTDRKRTRGRTAEKQERTPSDDQSRTERKSRTGQKSTTGARPKAGQQAHARLERRKGKSKPRRHTSAVRELGAEIRLNKFLAEAGVAARRKADELIASGVVRVNGKVVTELGSKVNPHRDEVSVRGTPVYIEGQLLYILMNKPKDCITTTSDEKGRRTVMDLIPAEHHVYPVGRLDRNTTGALLLTNDGDLANQLMHPRFHVQKTYVIELTRKIKPQDIQKLRTGIRLEDGLTAPCEAEVLDTGGQGLVVGIVLHEGRNRQVRRMFESLGYEIRKLDRVAYAGLTLSGLRRGSWRYLEDNEVGYLRNLAARQRG